MINLAIAAAFIQDQDYYHEANWDLGVMNQEEKYPVETYTEPKQVATAVNSFWKGRRLLTPIGGGVSIQPRKALERDNILSDDQGTVNAARESIDINSLPKDKWWWD